VLSSSQKKKFHSLKTARSFFFFNLKIPTQTNKTGLDKKKKTLAKNVLVKKLWNPGRKKLAGIFFNKKKTGLCTLLYLAGELCANYYRLTKKPEKSSLLPNLKISISANSIFYFPSSYYKKKNNQNSILNSRNSNTKKKKITFHSPLLFSVLQFLYV